MSRRRNPFESLKNQSSALFPKLLSELSPPPSRPSRRRKLPSSGNANRAGKRPSHQTEVTWLGGMVYVADFCGVGEATLSRFNLELIEVDSDDFVIGHCTEAGRRYEVEVTCETANRSVDANCSCAEAARSAGYCEHVGAFALYLAREMAIRDSPIRAEILKGLNLEPVKLPDPAEEALALLDQCLAEGVAEDTGSDKFRPTETAERVIWRLSIKSGYVELTPLLQKRKKRGSGWTKGRALRPDTLREGSYTLTPQDLRILSCVKRDYYYGDEMDVLAALKAMVGYDRVEFNETPVTVKHLSFGIRVVKTSDGKGYALQLENPHSTAFVIDGELIILQSDSIGIVGECSPGLVQLTKAIGQGSTIVPAERVEELLTRVRALSKAITVHLPTELSAKTENVESKPVMRLISRSDGQLQCGMRVRENDRLFRPGEGVLVRYAQTKSAGAKKGNGKTKAKSKTKGKGESNGQVVQYRRDPNSEISNCKSIARQLGLANAEQMTDWDWRFFDFDDSLQFLEAMSTTGEELGVEALWDEESVAPVRVLGAVSAKNLHVELKRKKDWFGIEGGFSLGNQDFTLPELLAAVDSEPAKGYTELRPGMWAKITDRLRKRLAELRDVTHANRSSLEIDVTAMPIIQSLQENELDIKASKEWQESVARLEKSKNLKPVPSKKLKAELRDYQVDGFRWMRRLAEWGVGGCLADDMGLGKTVQTLAVLIDRAKEGPALVIAPTSVGFNWQRETEKFAPSLSAHLYRETERAGFLKGVKKNDIVICSYGLALRDAKALSEIQWGTLVLDEAQFIKNARSKTAQAIRTIPAAWKLALTGTPMENHLGELWSLFRTISPGLFGSWEQFRKRFASPIERDNNPDRQRALSRLIQPFVLRRTKAEVLKDLPERTEINLYVDLSPEERTRYDEMRLAAVGELDQVVGATETNDQRFRVLAMLTRLRQIACHVGLVDETWKGESAKLVMLMEKVKELKEEGHHVLIFSQFTKYLGLIREAMIEHEISLEYLDGKTPAKVRQECVDRFQKGETDAFLISLKAGGTGLNLTAADYVIHMDPWWNPAVEDQATDRSHRIGQTRPVIVYRIIAKGTIEDQILSLHADKRDLVSGVMEGTQKAGSMTTADLLDLIRGTG